jgi:hypothetical protein
MTAPPSWFHSTIASNVAQLYAMGLEGTPAADVMAATVRVWSGDLWESRTWDQQDVPRINTAFRQLRTTRHRWPGTVDFLALLPVRIPALPKPVCSEEQAQKNLQRLAAMVDELLEAKNGNANDQAQGRLAETSPDSMAHSAADRAVSCADEFTDLQIAAGYR